MAAIGRSLRLTPEVEEKILLGIRTGAPLEVAAGAAGIAAPTFWQWMKAGRIFGQGGASPWPDRYQDPETQAILAAFAEKVERAENETHLLFAGVVRSRSIEKRDASTAIGWMRMRWGKHYAERVEISGPEGGPVQMEIAAALEGLTDSDLDAALERLRAQRGDPAPGSGAGTPEESPEV